MKVGMGGGCGGGPFSVILAARRRLVTGAFRVAETVGAPVSPARWREICTGMQVLKNTAGDVVEPTLAITPPRPGPLAVARPLASTETTVPSADDQLRSPTLLVISVPL